MADERINEDVRYEHHGIDLRVLLFIACGIIVLAVAINTSLYALYRSSLKHKPETVTEVQSQFTKPPEPRLQPDAAADLAGERESQQQRIDSYGWIDHSQRMAHVPIERAMDLMIEKHGSGQQ